MRHSEKNCYLDHFPEKDALISPGKAETALQIFLGSKMGVRASPAPIHLFCHFSPNSSTGGQLFSHPVLDCFWRPLNLTIWYSALQRHFIIFQRYIKYIFGIHK
jgi:hypothetical protein